MTKLEGGKQLMDPILVTGGAGYIGSHTCKALCRAELVASVNSSLTLRPSPGFARNADGLSLT
jgi:nucleoside-diphosphate-sugar epimerase